MANNNGTMNKASESSGMSKGAIIAIIIGVLLIVVLIGVIIGLAVGKNKDKDVYTANDNGSADRGVVVNEQNVAGVMKELENVEYVEPGMYEVTQNTTWNFENGSSPAKNAYVENSTANTNSVYFDVLLGDDEEVIYKSPILPVGSVLNDITLDKKLEAGNYDCVIKYTLIDEDGKDLSSVRLTMTIVVEN